MWLIWFTKKNMREETKEYYKLRKKKITKSSTAEYVKKTYKNVIKELGNT